MDAIGSFLIAEILKSINDGNLTKLGAYISIFLLLWLQLRGLRKEFKTLNTTITTNFANGEKRFDTLEKKDIDFEHRITVLEEERK